MSADLETMMYARATPWHGEGVNVGEEGVTAKRAIKAAGLDWEVAPMPVVAVGDPEAPMEIEDPDNVGSAVVRLSDRKLLGLVGPGWTPVQNAEAFEFLDSLTGAGGDGLRYETAGALRGGRIVWMLASLRDTPEIVVDGCDPVKPYLLLSNAHDGTASLRVKFTATRVVCANTLAIAHREAGADGFAVRHTRNVEALMRTRSKVLELARRSFDLSTGIWTQATQVEVDPSTVDAFIAGLLPATKDATTGALKLTRATLRARDRVQDLFEGTADGANLGRIGTAWKLYNAATQWATHEAAPRSASRVDTLLYGVAGDTLAKADDLLKALLQDGGADLRRARAAVREHELVTA